MDILPPRHKLRRDRNTPRRLHLVPRQHPNPDPRIPQQLQRALHIILQLVLHARQPKQLQIALQVLAHHPCHRLVAPVEADRRRVVRGLELIVERSGEALARHDEGAEALARHVRRLLLEPVVPLHDAGHHDVGALLQECDLACLRVADDDAHALALGGEGEDLEDVEVQVGPGWCRQRHPCAIAECEGEADRCCPCDNGHFVGGRCLVCYCTIIIGDWSNLKRMLVVDKSKR
jgi:hypothetical protein